MRLNKLVWALLVVMLAAALTSCNIGKAPEPTPDVNGIYTSAAQTMIAGLSAAQTQTAAAVPPTLAPTNTPAVSATALATFAISTGSIPFGGTALATPLSLGTPLPTLPAGTANSLLAYSFPVGCDNAAYVGNTPKDKTQYPPGKKFDASFSMVNLGTCTWDEGYKFAFLEGDKLTATPEQIVIRQESEFTKPNAGQAFITHMVAPNQPGEYISYWQMMNDAGVRFGSKVFVDIIVVKPGADTPTPSH